MVKHLEYDLNQEEFFQKIKNKILFLIKETKTNQKIMFSEPGIECDFYKNFFKIAKDIQTLCFVEIFTYCEHESNPNLLNFYLCPYDEDNEDQDGNHIITLYTFIATNDFEKSFEEMCLQYVKYIVAKQIKLEIIS